MLGTYRFVLAINVVIFHILAVPAIGPLAVYSFFILSGFLMTHIMHQTYGYSINGFKKYSLNRFYRLYPIYWCFLLLSLLIIFIVDESFSNSFHGNIQYPDSIVSLIANVTMIYPNMFPSEFPIRVSPATWALTIEIFFYVLIGLGLSRNKLITWLWFLVSFVSFLYKNLILTEFTFGYGSFLAASLPFSAGALVYYYKKGINTYLKTLKIHNNLLISLFLCNIFVAGFSGFTPPDYAWKIEYLCTGINLIISTLLTVNLSSIKSKKTTFTKMDRELGDLSYPIYVFHWGAACLASWLLYEEQVKDLSVFSLGLLITFFFSFAINILVNKRVEQIRNKIKNAN